MTVTARYCKYCKAIMFEWYRAIMFEWYRCITRYCRDGMPSSLDPGALCIKVIFVTLNEDEDTVVDEYEERCVDCDEILTGIEVPKDLYKALFNRAVMDKKDYAIIMDLGVEKPEFLNEEDIKHAIFEALI